MLSSAEARPPPQVTSASFPWLTMNLSQRSSELQLFLCTYVYYVVITFMCVSLTGLLTPPRAWVLSSNLCIINKLKSMLSLNMHLVIIFWMNELMNHRIYSI